MKEKLHELVTKNSAASAVWQPHFYRLSATTGKNELEVLLNTPGLIVYDEILGQVQELVKSLDPKIVYSKPALTEAALQHIGKTPMEEYGVWVYYPWSNKLVHILDEDEYVFVRTSRNQYKISPEERRRLAGKKIGVIGLSVGQSVSLTLAMERICTELRLTDFDILELTNLNRIRTGVHNLGLPKVYSVAREIAEIDPFIKVKCFPQGLNESNMDEFFTGGGKLDLLIEESDGFDIKIMSRYKARELQVPVVMEASDRCMIDVERFDLEPKRSILHGLVDHLDINKLKSLKTNEEKIPYMLDVLGLETASTRLKASMLEIEQTINTWPQLASAVTMGGGITADISRRLLLGQYTESGRYHIDIEDLVGNAKPQTDARHRVVDFDYPELTLNEMENTAKTLYDSQVSDIGDKDLDEIMKAAIMAPSAGNNQPWKWLAAKGSLFLFHDKKQSVSWADFKDLISHISFGTAIETVHLKANELGYDSESKLFPIKEHEKLVAVFTFKKTKPGQALPTDLHQYIFKRCTNRRKGEFSEIEPAVFEAIKKECRITEGAVFSFTTQKKEIETISRMVAISERLRFMNPQGHHDFYTKELKWNRKGEEIKEGLDVKTLELNYTDEIGLKVASDPAIITLLNAWKGGGAFEKLSYKTISTSSAIGIISMPAFSSLNWINGGRAVQRAWLCCTKHGLAVQPISAPLFFNMQLQHGGEANFTENEKKEFEMCYKNITSVFPILETHKGLFMFRLSHSGSPGARSLRKDINDVYFSMTPGENERSEG
jgi:tRNA A37 threonylcarbamoyladenosine dehydratase